MLNFNELKKNAALINEKISSDLKDTGTQRQDDERLWSLTVDKAGNGSALIRFLPPPKGEDQPFVRVWHHGFKGPSGQWYFENSLTTIGQDDPVSEYNSQLWATGIESNKKLASSMKRKLTYYSNIYVINDQMNPANNGTVRLFKYGPMIFDLVKSKQIPEFEDKKPVNVFDFWAGANLRLRARNDATRDNQRQYDRSEWESEGALFEDDAKLEEIWLQQHSLQQFLAPSQFKSYDELKQKFQRVVGLNTTGPTSAREMAETKAPETAAPQQKAATTALDVAANTAEDGDDNLDWFARLAQED